MLPSCDGGCPDSAAGVTAVCGHVGCTEPGTKLCSRCGKEAYCSADCQRKAWKEHKLVCQKVETPDSAISELLRAGRLYSAQQQLAKLPKGNARLSAEFEEKVKVGIYSEIVDNSIRLEDIPAFGRGYVAVRDIADGEALLLDTAFASAPLDGKKEYHFLIAEKAIRRGKNPARRSNSVADAQADFFFDRVMNLPLKGGMERAYLAETLDKDQTEQILACGIAEGSSLLCSEEPNFMGLFAAAAWFNHSCAPNAVVEASRSTAVVHALMPILRGTEVTISYLPHQLLENGALRRERLKGGRGFDCRCSQCTAEATAEALPE